MKIDDFVEFLLDYNQKVNLISRQSTRETLRALISESLMLKDRISTSRVIDVGSGGGLLGIPLAISLPEDRFILVETIRKKAMFLRDAIKHLKLDNVWVWDGAIQEWIRHYGEFESSMVSRGFPRIETLAEYVYKKKIRELVVISSIEKIKKIQGRVASIHQNRYNIPSRDNLIVFKLENVSRETLSNE